MAYFDFSSLIRQYSTDFTVIIPSKGDYNSKGDFVKGKPAEKTMSGAIISHRQSKVYKSEGKLTEQDRALYMLEPIDFALQDAKVIHDNKVYSIENSLDNAVFTGVYAYTLKFVSVFSGGDDNAE